MMAVEQSHKESKLLLTGRTGEGSSPAGSHVRLAIPFTLVTLTQLLSQCKYLFPVPQMN